MTDYINFMVGECTFLRYYLPITIEANKRNVKSKYFIRHNGKYNSPLIEQNYQQIIDLSKKYNFEVFNMDDINNHPGVTFIVEGVDIDKLDDNHKKIVIAYLADFTILYKSYIDKADNVIIPNKFWAEYYDEPRVYTIGGQTMGGTLSGGDKNLYLGSPKYDIVLDKDETYKKYNIKTKKNALLVFPKMEYIKNPQILHEIYNSLKILGYTVIVKTRGKDFVDNQYRKDLFFADKLWFPHASMELISVSDIIINFGSAVLKECIMLNKPTVNFAIKPFKHLDFLFNGEHLIELDINNFNHDEFSNAINSLLNTDLTEAFNTVKENYLFEPKNVCKNILDHLKI